MARFHISPTPGRLLLIPLLVRAVPIGLIAGYVPHSGRRQECALCYDAVLNAGKEMVLKGWGFIFTADGNGDDLRGTTFADHLLAALVRIFQLRSATRSAGPTMPSTVIAFHVSHTQASWLNVFFAVL